MIGILSMILIMTILLAVTVAWFVVIITILLNKELEMEKMSYEETTKF